MSEKRELIFSLLDSIEELNRANMMTGIFDNIRFQESKKGLSNINISVFYESEIKSRSNVEKRAFCRTRIDSLLKRILVEGKAKG